MMAPFDEDQEHRDFRQVFRGFVAKEITPMQKNGKRTGDYPAKFLMGCQVSVATWQAMILHK